MSAAAMAASAPDNKRALLLACAEFSDPKLPRLRSPTRDAEVLGSALSDRAYEVIQQVDCSAQQARLAIEDFLAAARPGDVHLLYFSCHGVQDPRGELYFAFHDTRQDRPAATAVAAEWVREQIRGSRSRTTIVLVDCCFSGAFLRGMRARDGGDANVASLVRDLPAGTGVAVLTASGETEYSLEDSDDRAAAAARPSYFTEAVVAGISSGAADRDGDGRITVDELYNYVYRRVVDGPSPQRPRKMGHTEGDVVIAEVARRLAEPPLPPSPPSQDSTALLLPETSLPPWPPPPPTAIGKPSVYRSGAQRRRRRRVAAASACAAVLGVAAVVTLAASETSDETPTPDPTTAGAWRRIDDIAAPVDSPGVVPLNGELWVVGGLLARSGSDASGKATDKVQIFDPVTARWRDGPSLPTPIDHAAIASDGNRIWVIGGQIDDGEHKVARSTVFVLDDLTSQWRKGPPLPARRQAGAAAWDGRRLVFGGGRAERADSAYTDVWVLEGGKWRRIGQLQQAREHLAATSDGQGRVWFLGGRYSSSRLGLTDVAEGDTVNPAGQMRAVGAPAAVWDPAAGPCVLGGTETDQPTAAITCKDGPSPWPSLAQARAGAGAAILNEEIYFVGGYDVDGLSARVDVLTP